MLGATPTRRYRVWALQVAAANLLAQGLRTAAPSLKSLSVTGCNLSAVAGKAIIDALGDNASLIYLSTAHNKLGSVSGGIIAKLVDNAALLAPSAGALELIDASKARQGLTMLSMPKEGADGGADAASELGGGATGLDLALATPNPFFALSTGASSARSVRASATRNARIPVHSMLSAPLKRLHRVCALQLSLQRSALWSVVDRDAVYSRFIKQILLDDPRQVSRCSNSAHGLEIGLSPQHIRRLLPLLLIHL